MDKSHVVINFMAGKYRQLEDMEFSVMDATKMDALPSKCFDLIIDKALMDSLLCSEESSRDVTRMVSEMHRVLKDGGTYVVVSHGSPSNRLQYLDTKTRPGEWIGDSYQSRTLMDLRKWAHLHFIMSTLWTKQ